MVLSQAKYYKNHKKEFLGEEGHEKLLKGLKMYNEEIQDKKVIGLDIGCCIGDYICNIKEICKEQNREILCFEPNLYNFSMIKPQDEDIKLFNVGIGNKNDTKRLYAIKNSVDNNSENQHSSFNNKGAFICDVNTILLDDIIDEYKDEDFVIKFIKIDTEGYEYNVFKGFEKYLDRAKYIIFECSDCLDDFRGPGIERPMKQIVDLLSNNGFDTYRIGTKKLIKVNDEYWDETYEKIKYWSNCFAIKKDNLLIDKLITKDFYYKY